MVQTAPMTPVERTANMRFPCGSTAYSSTELLDKTQIAALEAATTPERVMEILGAVQV